MKKVLKLSNVLKAFAILLVIILWLALYMLLVGDIVKEVTKSRNNPAPGLICIENCSKPGVYYSSNTVRVFVDEENGVICYQRLASSSISCVR